MHSLRFAEWLLSLVTAPDRAAATVGDFAESAPDVVRFWVSVARVGFSLLWKDVVDRPARSASLAIAGAVMQMAFFAPFGTFCFLLATAAGLLAGSLTLDLTWAVAPLFSLLVLSAAVPVPFLTGRWIARRAPRHELAPCLALTILESVLWVSACLAFRGAITVMNGLTGIVPTFFCLLTNVIALHAGAIWIRQRPSEPRWFEVFPFDFRPGIAASVDKLRSGATPEPLPVAARTEQQRIVDWMLLAVFLAGAIEGRLPTSGVVLPAIFDGLLALAMFFNAAFGRPFQWSKVGGRVLLWPGRILFSCVGAYLAWTSWLALRL
jgi:hypothetical protein